MYLVDTDIIIWLLRGHRKYLRWFEDLKQGALLFISTMTVAEVYKNVFPSEFVNTEQLLGDFGSLDVKFNIAKQGGLYWNQFIKKVKNLNIVDCIIAATAKENNLTLLTLNTKHFPMSDIHIFDPIKKRKI